jgi:RNA polymerase sigma-70 factor (ECF subfamily)
VGDGDAAGRLDGAEEVGRIFREESGRSLAALIGVFGDIDLAEDAVQEAFAVAVCRWPGDGVPPNPGGWITTTARHRALDRLRRESRGRELLSQVAVLSAGQADRGMSQEVGPVPDDRLRLIFTCCHPALSTQGQVALTLRLGGGLSTEQVARSFLVSEATMARRLVRAKHKIKAAKIPYRVPEAQELPDRLGPVLAVVYLIYNAGVSGPAEPGLCAEAIRLARILAALMPDEPEVAGLLALLLLIESRRSSRLRPDGSLVVLGAQDRPRWDRALIDAPGGDAGVFPPGREGVAEVVGAVPVYGLQQRVAGPGQRPPTLLTIPVRQPLARRPRVRPGRSGRWLAGWPGRGWRGRR